MIKNSIYQIERCLKVIRDISKIIWIVSLIACLFHPSIYFLLTRKVNKSTLSKLIFDGFSCHTAIFCSHVFGVTNEKLSVTIYTIIYHLRENIQIFGKSHGVFTTESSSHFAGDII